MITCVVTYTIDPAKTREFEAFAWAWMDLVGRHGGVESGCVLRYERTFMRPLLPTGQD